MSPVFRPIFFLTDFGLKDPFAGIMKAVVLGLCPQAILVDLTHEIGPQRILEASIVLEDALPYLPDPAIVCAVVDPGVGSNRPALAVRSRNRWFIAPDNGLLTPVFTRDSAAAVWQLLPDKLAPLEVSATFHGRDVFAPAAGRLARGDDPAGFAVPVREWVRMSLPALRFESDETLLLEIVAIDRFGNLTLNLARASGPPLPRWVASGDFELCVGTRTIARGLAKTFSDVAAGQAAVYWSSAGRLEIGINRGSAAQVFGLGVGDGVVLRAIGRKSDSS